MADEFTEAAKIGGISGGALGVAFLASKIWASIKGDAATNKLVAQLQAQITNLSKQIHELQASNTNLMARCADLEAVRRDVETIADVLYSVAEATPGAIPPVLLALVRKIRPDNELTDDKPTPSKPAAKPAGAAESED